MSQKSAQCRNIELKTFFERPSPFQETVPRVNNFMAVVEATGFEPAVVRCQAGLFFPLNYAPPHSLQELTYKKTCRKQALLLTPDKHSSMPVRLSKLLIHTQTFPVKILSFLRRPSPFQETPQRVKFRFKTKLIFPKLNR